jgi:hypothetical protein
MKPITKFWSVVVLVLSLAASADIARAGSSIGGGLHYLHNLGDISEGGTDFSQESFGILGSFQFGAGLITFEGDVEYIFDFIGSDKGMTIPSAWALIGGMIYGGAGIGIGYWDGDFMDNPFYALRGGVNLGLGGMNLDVFGTYQFWSDDDLKDLTGEDLDSVTFAAVLRFGLGGE